MHARRQQEGRGRLSGTPPRAHAERREAAEQAYFTGNMAAQASTVHTNQHENINSPAIHVSMNAATLIIPQVG